MVSKTEFWLSIAVVVLLFSRPRALELPSNVVTEGVPLVGGNFTTDMWAAYNGRMY